MKTKVLVKVCDLPKGMSCGDRVCELLRNQGYTGEKHAVDIEDLKSVLIGLKEGGLSDSTIVFAVATILGET